MTVEDVPECEFDEQCPSQMACIVDTDGRNRCLNPCTKLHPCASSAKCKVVDSLPVRTMVCECHDSVPDINGECKKIPKIKTGCDNDDECNDAEACISGVCKSPCNCGVGARCHTYKHRSTCSCIEGYEGNPSILCQAIGCRSNSECDSDKACVFGQCVNLCLEKNPCARNANCFMRTHEQECRCAEGFRGNPLVECRAIECMSNNDCPNDKRCLNEQCVNPCIYENNCALKAECIPQDHKSLCKCLPGFIGNPYVNCAPEPKYECVIDSDCSSNTLACLDHKCQNPCEELKPCTSPAKCQVIPSSPVRTMVCVCPDGYISGGNGICEPIQSVKVIGCVADSDCAPDKSCINALCVSPCNCGPNSECRIKEHKPVSFVLNNCSRIC